ncbi:MAG: SWIM zinc finger family protein [Phycisphaeraceae bacterium]
MISSDGHLLASVQGTRRYATTVWLGRAKQPAKALQSRCSCPVGFDGCKHAVAVVAEYLQALAEAAEIPDADPDDPRWDVLAADEDEESLDDEDGDVDWQEPAPRRSPRRRRRSGQAWEEKIRKDITGRDHEELVELVMSLTDRFPELRQEFRERIMLQEGDANRLVSEARREIRETTAEPGWQHPWDGEGSLPDYSRLQHRLERLVELGQADAVVKLGEELIRRGMEQVELSHDEGETAMALGECLGIVFQGLARSSLSTPQKLLFAINAHLNDEFDVIGDAADVILEAKHASKDWSAVADELQRRLKPAAKRKADDFHDRFQRDRITNWLSVALEKAGRNEELLALYEQEARITHSYERLVRYLLDTRRYEDAQRWAQEGIEQTREKWPGIASNLAQRLAEVAKGRQQWDLVAAHAAWRLFDQPSQEHFKQLVAAAGKARSKTSVREQALRFLETGQPPIRVKADAKGERRVTVDRDWPLPVPEHLALLMRNRTDTGPYHDVLLEMALSAKRADDILHWYDQLATNGRRSTWHWGGAGAYANRVAEAVANTHPERALAIYQSQLEANLTEAKTAAYEACASYLRKMRPILKKLGREDEWRQRVEQIREDYRRRPRFMEILDGIEGRTIVGSHKVRRRKA